MFKLFPRRACIQKSVCIHTMRVTVKLLRPVSGTYHLGPSSNARCKIHAHGSAPAASNWT
eukprot:6199969-Pleurochrysis_carterae.AAC.4